MLLVNDTLRQSNTEVTGLHFTSAALEHPTQLNMYRTVLIEALL